VVTMVIANHKIHRILAHSQFDRPIFGRGAVNAEN
jgi:hypothetical protein